jgi:hypothetical protein
MLFACNQEADPGDDDDDGSGNGSGSGVGSGAGPAECQGDEVYCADTGTVVVCEGGQGESVDCGTLCGTYGYASDGCGDDTCQCGSPTNATCSNGVGAFCACAEWAGESCSNDEATGLYESCHAGEPDIAPTVTCFGTYVSGDTVDCAAAVEGCL